MTQREFAKVTIIMYYTVANLPVRQKEGGARGKGRVLYFIWNFL